MEIITKLFHRRNKVKQVNQFYSSASLCPLRAFNQVLSGGSLQPLIISGEPTDEQLEEAWGNIYSEFSEIIKDKTTDLHFIAIKQATAKRHKISYLSVLLQVYAQTPTPEFTALIEAEGFRTFESAEQTYKSAYGKLKKMQDDLNFSEKQQVKKEAQDFELVISELERYQGYQFDQDKMTVKHFANIYKRFKENNENERKNRTERPNKR